MSELYTTLFNTSNTSHENDDITMEIINQLHGHSDLNRISNYYDINTYNKLHQNTNNLSILHINSRSLPKNFDNITAFLNSLIPPPNILAITETWLSDLNKNYFQLSGYHTYHLVRHTRSRGGVSVFISNNIQSMQINELTIVNDNIEINTTRITINSATYILCTIYRPHSKHEAIDQFTDIICTLLQRDIIKNNKVIMIGDLNINLLEHTTHNPTNNYLAALQLYNFYPHISRPTRFPDSLNLSEPSLLDHIYTNFNNNFTSGIIHFSISDHLPVFINISIQNFSEKSHKFNFRSFTQCNKQLFSNKICAIDWNQLLCEEDLNANFDKFLSKLNNIYNESFPIITRTVSEKRLNTPWINQEIINAIKTKNKLYKDFKIGAVTEQQYKQYRNTLNYTIKQVKQIYYINLFTRFKNDTAKIWKTLNQLSGKSKKDNIQHILYNNEKITGMSEIANSFNEYFIDIPIKLDQNLPPPTADPLTYLLGDYPNSIAVPTICPQDVVQIIKSLKNKKCNNIHEISISVIKTNSYNLAIPLSILFNQSINNGKFPQRLKHATVIPIHKKGSKEEISNYRPISLLSTFSKIFEKLIKPFLINYLDAKNILHPKQFGFRRGLSTFDALNTLNEEIFSTLDSKHSLLNIYIDFSKAFDIVNHDILLNKLHHYGIRGIIHDWFRDYLSQRTQSIILSQHVSSSSSITCGVPQGSVLGPILFLIYINDLPNIFSNLKSILFADDSTLYLTGDNITEMINTANNDLQTLYTWCLSNRLTINSDKTFYMIFTNKSYDNLPPLIYHEDQIKKTNNHTLLGITYDNNMTFKTHISNLVLKLSRIVSLIYRVKDLMPTYLRKTLYNVLVLPHYQYCSPIWCSTYPTHLLPLFRLQKKIIRIITNSDYFDHTQPLFKQNNILKLFDINRLQIATYMYKSLHNNTTLRQPQHNYPTRTRDKLVIPNHNLTLYKHSLAYLGPKTWNAVPQHLKNIQALHLFKKHYKKHIILQY